MVTRLDDYLGWVWADVEAFGKRIGLFDRGGGDGPPEGGEPVIPAPTKRAVVIASPEVGGANAMVAQCFGCLLTLICGRQLSPA